MTYTSPPRGPDHHAHLPPAVREVRENARKAVRNAVRAGRLVKPLTCEGCGDAPGDGRRLHAHHADYDDPLRVEWLCVFCHLDRHRRRRIHCQLTFGPEEYAAVRAAAVAADVSVRSFLKRAVRAALTPAVVAERALAKTLTIEEVA